ncbi:MAG: hypothetical protein H6745_24190 [Deltaproteobacteria bacterium]|nr:hypothetical protein [Deltaproteobacteria bacterium]
MAKKKKTPSRSSGGGALSGMRSGMKRIAGTNAKGKKAQSEPPSFMRVFLWGVALAVVVALVWSLAHR